MADKSGVKPELPLNFHLHTQSIYTCSTSSVNGFRRP